jgi:hypothetical protein
METMPWKHTDWSERKAYPKQGYTIDTWANGYGVWHAQAIFGSGVGNTPEGERMKYKAVAHLKRTIRRELMERSGPNGVGRLSYEIASNHFDAQNRLWSITVKEKS